MNMTQRMGTEVQEQISRLFQARPLIPRIPEATKKPVKDTDISPFCYAAYQDSRYVALMMWLGFCQDFKFNRAEDFEFKHSKATPY